MVIQVDLHRKKDKEIKDWEYQEKKEKRQRGREHQEAEKNKGLFGSEASLRG